MCAPSNCPQLGPRDAKVSFHGYNMVCGHYNLKASLLKIRQYKLSFFSGASFQLVFQLMNVGTKTGQLPMLSKFF